MPVKKNELVLVPNEEHEPEHKVLMFKDHEVVFPDLFLRVAVLGPPEDTRGFADMFVRAGCCKADSIQDADLVVFTGGPDVDPAYYGEKQVANCYVHDERDYADIGHYAACLDDGIPMLGICRGAQFLAVMAGGKLVQDCDNHNSDHSMVDIKSNTIIHQVSSRHHQAVLPFDGMDVIATAYKSTYRQLSPAKRVEKVKLASGKYGPDIEAFFIRETCALGIQGHPEYKCYEQFTSWSLKQIENYISNNPDIANVDIGGGEFRYRIQPEIQDQRRIQIMANAKEQIVTSVKGEK